MNAPSEERGVIAKSEAGALEALVVWRGRRARRWHGLAPLCCALAVGCAPPQSPEPPPPAPEARLLGHRVTVDGRRCFDAESLPTIRVAIDDPGGFVARWGQTGVPSRAEARAGGVLLWLALEAPAGDETLSVEWRGRVIARWPACFMPPPTAWPGLEAAVARRTAGAPAEAVPLIEAQLPRLDRVGVVHGWMEIGRARRQLGDIDGARQAWSRAAALAEASGLVELATAALRSTIWAALWIPDLDDAARRIEQAAALTDEVRDPIGALRLDYNRALFAHDVADYTTARRLLERVARESRRLGADELAVHAAQMQGMVLAALGRYDEALAALPPATDGVSTLNRGWLLLQAMDAGVTPFEHAALEVLFSSARTRFIAARDLPFATISGLNLAWLALRRGDVDGARAHFEREADGVTAGYAAAFARLVAAELAAAEGRLDEARQIYAEIEAIDVAQGTSGWDVRWRAALGAARVATRMGDGDGALDAYRRALHRLDVLGQGTGVREGRASFFADRAPLVDEAIDALLSRGAVEEAFEVADHARARVVRALEERVQVARLSPADRAAWMRHRQDYTTAEAGIEALRSQEKAIWRSGEREAIAAKIAAAARRRAAAFDAGVELLRRAAPIDADRQVDLAALRAQLGADAALVLVRRRGTGLDVFRVTATGVVHARTAGDPLLPWSDELMGWRRLHLVADDSALAETIARRPLASGRPLAAEVALSRAPYAGSLLAEADAVSGPPIVVADPRGDLPEAAREGRWVDGLLGGRLFTGPAATTEAVIAALDGARLFHFAGHGDLRAADPWQAHLRLAGDGRLTLESILFHRPRVGLVVLSGCETGARLVLAAHEVIGLPEAFLAAGSRAVLATHRPVGDAEARLFIEQFYDAGGADDPAEGLRRAVRASRATGHDTWEAFELWSRSKNHDRRKEAGARSRSLLYTPGGGP